ncbi:MAG TPA: signal recognition particle-docking protein FtsY [Acidimicrobiales bacterium]|jgi:fused signal recognition particle receptor|nr:signal recognition particle-docking protein FtsY [Acidimicrobiales bacterium]
MEIVLGLVAVLVLSALVAAFVAARPRRRATDLEPPAAPPLAPPEAAPPAPPKAPKAKRPAIPSEDELARQAAEVVAEAEAVLAGAREEAVEPAEPVEVEAPPKPRFRDRLGKARGLLAGYLGTVRARTKIDDDTWDELEEALIRADVGIAATTALLDQLRAQVKAEGIATPEALVDALKDNLKKRLSIADRTLRIEPGMPNVWLFVGVNGVGKTTTIGKVGHQQVGEGRTVIMAAGDTFRAAAAEQLELWSKRVGATLVRGNEGGDPGAVVFDAVERAAARHTDLVLADTAGRLHTKINLMEELKKVRRVADKPPGKVTEVLLVIDATTGQNGLVQARQFTEAVEVTGVVLTKLDGTAKGGIVLAIQNDLGIPIKLVGLGETADDLIAFDPDEFIDALFA